MAVHSKHLTRERILNAAYEEFAQHGFHYVTVRDIATCAGTSHAAVHWHFGSKSGVYAETVRIASERFVEIIRGSTPVDLSFRAAAAAWVHHLADDTRIARLLRSLGADHRHPAVDETAKSVNRTFRDFWRGWLRDHHPLGLESSEADPTDLAHAIVAALAGIALVKFHGDPKPPITSLATLGRLIEGRCADDRSATHVELSAARFDENRPP